MATLELERSYLSVANILRAADPKAELTNELVALLAAHVKRLGIRWNPSAFRAGLRNPDLPEALLRKLEDLLEVAEPLNWSLPKTLVDTLDQVLEDIEACNPAFLASFDAARASGRISSAAVRKRLRG